MAASVISDRRPRGKRGRVWNWLGRRFGALVVTIAALGFVSWLSPILGGAPPPLVRPGHDTVLATLAPKTDVRLLKPLDKLGWNDAQAIVPLHRRRGISLNERHFTREDGFEVLNASELDAISQAH